MLFRLFRGSSIPCISCIPAKEGLGNTSGSPGNRVIYEPQAPEGANAQRGCPLGHEPRARRLARQLGLENTLRPHGRIRAHLFPFLTPCPLFLPATAGMGASLQRRLPGPLWPVQSRRGSSSRHLEPASRAPNRLARGCLQRRDAPFLTPFPLTPSPRGR